jgi:hypothetical protein
MRSIPLLIAITAIMLFLQACKGCNSETDIDRMEGEWHLDSVRQGKDSSIVLLLLLNTLKEDSLPDFRFHGDTVFTLTEGDTDTTRIRLQTGKKAFITDTDKDTLQYQFTADGKLELMTTDSMVLVLKKESDAP